MRRLVAVAVVIAGVAVPVYAQRGSGGARGGSVGHSAGGFASHSGGFASRGFSGHSAPAFRGSFAPAGRAGMMGVPQFNGSRYYTPNVRVSAPGSGPMNFNRRPGYPVRGGGDRYRRPYVPYYGLGTGYGFGSGYWVNGELGPDFFDYPDSSYSDDSGYAAPAPQAYDQGDSYPGGYGPPPVEQAEAAPAYGFRPAYQSPQPAPSPEDAVTLIFKDGRPAEQIHNYMLTRTTLYVQDQHRQEIPVDELDLAATAKANKAAGVDFQLPGSGS